MTFNDIFKSSFLSNVNSVSILDMGSWPSASVSSFFTYIKRPTPA